jgi:hypothetical protein
MTQFPGVTETEFLAKATSAYRTAMELGDWSRGEALLDLFFALRGDGDA